MKFLAIESVLPSRKVTNDEILERVLDESRPHLSTSDLRLAERSIRFAWKSAGTRYRYLRAEGETPSALCAEVGRRALYTASMEPDEVDLLMYVGVGRGFLEPATASVFQDLLSLRRATCFDVMDACASWLRAIHIARAFIATDSYRNIMILNAEFGEEFGDYVLRSTAELDSRFPTFTIGEAATATLVTQSEENDEYAAEFRSFGDQREKCIIPLPNYAGYLSGNGPALEPLVFVSYGSELMEFGLARLVEHYSETERFNTFDPDIVFFHAASDGMSRKGMLQCGLDEEKGFYTHERFANTVSATIPLAMSTAALEGKLKHGAEVMLFVASAGISTALCRFRFLSGDVARG